MTPLRIVHLWVSEPVRLEGELCPNCWCAGLWVSIAMCGLTPGFVHGCTNCQKG